MTPFCLQLICQTGYEVMALTLIQTEDGKYDHLKNQKVVIHFITTRSHKIHFVQAERPFKGDLRFSQ